MTSSAYSASQLSEYLDLLKLPADFPDKPKDLTTLTSLFTAQIATLPYENLSLHYNKAHRIVLDPQLLFTKMVTERRGRGGYCMEIAILFWHMLRAMGWNAYLAGVRIRYRIDGVPQGDFSGWVHVVNIVTLGDGSKFSLDVAFGGDGPTKPLPLIPGVVTKNIGTQELRLLHDFIPEQTSRLPHQKLWIYQYRNGPDKEWNTFYSFPEIEFHLNDFKLMSYYTSTYPESFQTFRVLVVKFLRREGEEDIYGKVMMVNGIIKLNTGGKTEVVRECATEAERLAALKDIFGIDLKSEEVEGIIGTVTDLDVVSEV